MDLIPFEIVDRKLAFREIRVLHLLVPQHGLPAGSYALLEYYCPDPDCDCRRVMLNVVEEGQPNRFLASISYAFDADSGMAEPFLDRLNPQSKYAQDLLELVEQNVLIDRRYRDRLERHYALVKEAVANPDHPAYDRLQDLLSKRSGQGPRYRAASPRMDVGRNDPCPCGSGKKYKHCCMRKDR